MKFALFYEIPVPRPVGGGQRARRLPQHPRAGHRRRPLRLARVLDGRAPLPAGVLALLEPRGPLRRHRGRGPSGSASATACGSCPSPTTTRCARRSRWRCSTCSRAAGSTSGPAARPPGPSSRASASTPPRAAACGRRPSSTSWAAGPTRSTSSRASSGRCPGAASSPSRGRSPTRRCGAPPRATRATRRSATSASACARSPWACRPSEVKRKIDIYRAAVAGARAPLGAFVHNQAATFTMAMCAPDRDAGDGRGPRVLRVVPQDRRPPDRHADGLDGGAQPGARLATRTRPT